MSIKKENTDFKKSDYQIIITDMSCQHCVNAVEKAVLSVSDVTGVKVDLDKGIADISGGLAHQVVEAIKEAGFQAKIPDSCLLAENNTKTESISDPEPEVIESADSYQINIADMTCTSCVANVEKAIRSVAGVTQVQVNLVEKKAYIIGGKADTVISAVIDQGYDSSLSENKQNDDLLTLLFQGDINALSRDKILKALLVESGSEVDYQWPYVSLKTQEHPANLLMHLQDAGYSVAYKEQFEDPHKIKAQEAQQEIRRSWQRAALAGLVGVFIMAGDMSGVFPELSAGQELLAGSGQFFWGIMALLCLFTMWFSGRNYYKTALKQAKHLSSNMDTLVALGTSAAWLSSVIIIIDPEFIPDGGNHLYLDASVFILAFLQLGHALETRAKRITSEAIGALVQLAPKSAAFVIKDSNNQDRELLLPVSLLRKGDRIRIKPGETVPVDARIISGNSNIDESMLSGEAMLISKQAGDEVTGGTANSNGSLIVEVTRIGEETTLANIIHMVEQAQLSKPPIASLVDKVSAIFVPIVILIALTTFFGWLFFGPVPPLAFAFTTGIAVLVIACPCALGLATPIAIMVGTGRAAQLGILIKNSDALQSASHLTHLVMDKTGTLTRGKPEITHLFALADRDDKQLLQLAMSLESGSEHPLAEAVMQAAQDKGLAALECKHFQAISGYGVSGEIEQQSYFLGNSKLMTQRGIEPEEKWQSIALKEAHSGGTPIWLASSEQLLGLLILKDPIREESATAINSLHKLGIKVVMCTGDNHNTAAAVGQSLGIDDIHSDLLPEQKLQVIADLQQKGYRVGMVGDGVNDAPALAQADTGFAIGSGTDVAVESADITLAGDSLHSVAAAVEISSATLGNIKQNLLGAFIYNVIGIPLAAGLFYPLTGWLLNPMFASFAMAMSSVTVVTNANRLRFFKPRKNDTQ